MSSPLETLRNELQRFTDASVIADLAPFKDALQASNRRSLKDLMHLISVASRCLEASWSRSESKAPEERVRAVIDSLMIFFVNSIIAALENEKDNGSKQFREASKCLRALLDFVANLNGTASSVSKGARVPSPPFKTTEADILFTRVSDMASCVGQFDEIEVLLHGDGVTTAPGPDADRDIMVRAMADLREKAPAVKKLTEQSLLMWKTCLEEYHETLAPIYVKVANRVRSAYFPEEAVRAAGGALQALWNLHRVKDLCKVKQFSSVLAPESESAMREAVAQLEQIRKAVQELDKVGGSKATGGNLFAAEDVNGSPLIGTLAQLEVLKGQVGMIHNALAGFLKHAAGVKEAESLKKKVLKELDAAMEEVFIAWQTSVESDPQTRLDMGGRVMEFNQNGSVDVTFGGRLVSLMKEVRRFQQAGFKVSSEVLKRCDKAAEVYGKAAQLRQVCQFHNRIAERVIPCQQALFAPAAKQFDRLFAEKKKANNQSSSASFSKITWNDAKELEAFTKQASDCVEIVEGLNKTLRSAHKRISDLVIRLSGVSFLRQTAEWKRTAKKIKDTMDATLKHLVATVGSDSKGNPRVKDSDALMWRAHWDYQLAKVLAVQFRADLATLLSAPASDAASLARDASIEITALGECILTPPVETIRQDLIKNVASLISLPTDFEGVGGAPHVYTRVVEDAHDAVLLFFQQLEFAVRKASEVPRRLRPFAPIAFLGFTTAKEVEDMVVPEIKSIDDYKQNAELMQDLKAQLHRIPDFISVSVGGDGSTPCFRVSSTSFKAKFDAGFRLVMEALQRALSKFVNVDNEALAKDLKKALDSLPASATSLSEIASAQKAAFDIRKQMDSFKRRVYQVQDVRNSLREFAGDAFNSDEVTQLWSELTERLSKFNDMADKQRAQLKEQLSERIAEFENKVLAFSKRWQSGKPEVPTAIGGANPHQDVIRLAAGQMSDFRRDFEELEGLKEMLTEDCREFGVEAPSMAGFEDVRDEVKASAEGWDFIERFYEEMDAFHELNWQEFRPNIFKLLDFANVWVKQMSDVQSRSPQVLLVRRIASELSDSFPAFKAASCEAFNDRHWADLKSILQMSKLGIENKKITVGHLLERLPLMAQNLDKIKELADRAVGEVVLRNAVEELRSWIEQTEFTFSKTTAADNTEIPLVREWKELLTGVADNQAVLSSLKDSRFFSSFKEEAEQLGAKLGALDENFQLLNKVQRKWVHLEPIFGRGALPSETDRFERVNNDFKKLARDAERNKKVVLLATIPNLASHLTSMLDQLERCQKALNTFLEEKRAAFPRFYFLGDEDLLEILGQSSSPKVIQSHLKKLFAGINDVRFNAAVTQIDALVSSLGEEVPLKKAVPIQGPVESWLLVLSKEMQATLSQLLKEACLDEKARTDVLRWPSQVVSLAWDIQFTSDVDAALSNNRLPALKDSLEQQLQGLTSQPRRDALQQACLKALILDVIHRVEVVGKLIKHRVAKPTDWHWYRQLKFSLTNAQQPALENVPQRVEARMVDSVQSYTFEYQGNAPRLVFTPLTDQCYLTLMHGLHLGYGGNPYGPAGTGKTESVKALGAALGRQVLVFNCDEGIDFLSMGRIFVGLVRCGAWGCFDEFNRLLEEQLSAISQQIQVIQNAIKSNAQTCSLLGHDIAVNSNAGIFVTLNPAGKGYGGRSRLPDNLKALFRPVAMSVPDNELIAEVLLLAEGFRSGKKLAKKLVTLFLLCRQLLSPQQHYDWGLRALKTVLSLAGQQLASLIVNDKAEAVVLSEEQEEQLLLKSAMSNTLSKLTLEDAKRMKGLVADVFPGVTIEDISYPSLEKAIDTALKKFGLESIPDQRVKILQLHEASLQRIGIIIVGPSGCGKSTAWRVLHEAYSLMGDAHHTHVMNPKAISRQMLLGQLDTDTREWTDGVLTAAARKVAVETGDGTTHSWIVLDGDVDPAWVEALNTVLDDNRLLTMPHGDRIAFNERAHFLFETHDLAFASPATISRCGMLYLSDEAGQVQPLVRSWLSKRPQRVRKLLKPLFDEVFFNILNRVFELASQDLLAVDTTKVGMVQNVLARFPHKPSSGAADEEDGVLTHEEAWWTCKEFFALQLVLGFGGLFWPDQRAQLATEIFRLCRVTPPNPTDPLDVEGIIDTSASEHGVFKLIRVAAAAKVTDINPNSLVMGQFRKGRGGAPLVANRWSTLGMSLFQDALARERSVLLVGPQGCGKSILVRAAIDAIQKDQMGSISLGQLECNAQTSSVQIIQKLKQLCVSVTGAQGRTFRPRDASRTVLYVKDVNLPRPDQYNSTQVVSFLQQLATHGGFYDPHDLEFVHLDKVQVLASTTPASTLGRHALSTRYTANVSMAAIPEATDGELVQVFSAVAKAAFALNPQSIGAQLSEKLASSMVYLYGDIKAAFTTDQRPHFVFTPRDIQRWMQGVLRYTLSGNAKNEAAALDLKSDADLCAIVRMEASRVFRDRLVTDSEKQGFDASLDRHLATCFGNAVTASNLEKSHMFAAAIETVQGRTVVPGTLTSLTQGEFREKVYKAVETLDREERSLDIVLFPEFLQLVQKVDAALSTFGGSLLLVGNTGTGRRSAATLVSHMQRAQFVSPTAARDYSIREFRKDLKTWMLSAGVEDKRTVIFIEDFHISDPAFLELLNSLLASFEVPGLWSPEEMDGALHPLKESYSERPGDAKSLNEFFTRRLRENLRVVVSLDANHPSFISSLSANPALVTHCNVLWTSSWSSDTMGHVVSCRLGLPDQAFKQPPLNTAVTLSANPGSDVARAGAEVHKLLLAIHEGEVVTSGAPPKQLTSLMSNFQNIFAARAGAASNEATARKKGVEKLEQVQNDVAKLQADATRQQAQLAEQEAQAQKAMVEITKAMKVAADRRKEVEGLEVITREEEAKTAVERDLIQKELDQVEPILAEARKAVQGIDARSLQEVKSLARPPPAVQSVLSAVVRMVGETDDSWAGIKKFLGQSSSIPAIMNLDPKTVKKPIQVAVAKIIKDNGDHFEPAVIKRASVAAEPLAKWVKACLGFAEKFEKVVPMQRDLDEKSKKLYEAREKVEKCNAELVEIDQKVAALQEDHGKRKEECFRLKLGLEKAQTTLNKAQHLLSELSSEASRWSGQVKEVELAALSLPCHSALAAAFATYLGGAPEDVRALKVKRWSELVKQYRTGPNANTPVAPFDFLQFMLSDAQRLELKADGLPDDVLSAENAAMLSSASAAQQAAVPLIVDPASTATEWLKKKLLHEAKEAAAKNGKNGNAASTAVEVVMFNDEKFANALELAVRFGKTLICLEADSVDSLLVPLLKKDLTRTGPREVVRVGDRLVDYNHNFRLFLCTRNGLAPAALTSDVASLVQVVNFSVTRAGLESQLLAATLAHELPSLEARRSAILQKEETLKMQAAECEKKLLLALADSQGPILENEPLINTLAETKQAAQTIAQALMESQALQSQLESQRTFFLPIATLGAQLFMLLRQLSAVDPMYQFSLDAFKQVYVRTLVENSSRGAAGFGGNSGLGTLEELDGHAAPAADEAAAGDMHDDLIDEATASAKVQQLKGVLIQKTLHTFGRALFKKDRLSFALHLVHGVKPGLFGENEFAALMGTAAPLSNSGARLAAAASWVPADRRDALDRLRQVVNANVERGWRLTDNEASGNWQRWVGTEECETAQPPADVSAFQRVLLVGALRPDRLESAMTRFACEALAVTSLAPPPLDLRRLLTQEAACDSLTLFVVTPGADPSADVAAIAKDHFAALQQTSAATSNERYELRSMPMGGGNQAEAIATLRDCAAKGDWLLLQNVHLVTGWLSVFEKEFRSLTANGKKAHPNFRVILTSEPHPKFPSVLLEASQKITYEAPPGLKNNVERSLAGPFWTEAVVSKGHSEVRAQIMALCVLFHAVLQERRAFNPQGFSKFYEFTAADLQCAADTAAALVERAAGPGQAATTVAHVTARNVDWQSVRGVMELAIYGSRLENQFDARIVREYLRAFFCADALAASAAAGIAADDEDALLGDFHNNKKNAVHRNAHGTEPQLPSVQLPASFKLADLRAAFSKQLAEIDAPLPAFGLAPNVDRAVQRANSQRAVEQLGLIVTAAAAALGGSPGTGAAAAGGSSSRVQVWQKQLLPLVSFWQQHAASLNALASNFTKLVPSSSDQQVEVSPVDDFLIADCQRAMAAARRVDASLKALGRVVNASSSQQVEITSDMLRDGDALLRGEVPASWAPWKGASERPLPFLRALVAKSQRLHQEYLPRALERLGQPGSGSKSGVLGHPVRLADLIAPDVFLNALRQQTARVIRCPVDCLKMAAQIVSPSGGDAASASKAAAAESKGYAHAVLEGLRVEGATFDNGRNLVVGATRETAQLTAFPALKVSWVPKTAEEEANGLAQEASVEDAGSAAAGSGSDVAVTVPLYMNLLREDFLCGVQLPTNSRRDRVLNAAALVVDADE